MAGTPTFLNFLRIWIGFVAFMALGNSVQCFFSKGYVHERLYTLDMRPSDLSARLFGVWTLLAAVVRFSCAFNIENSVLYMVTLCSFILALIHFTSEVFIYETAAITAGTVAPLVVSSVSIVLMLIGLLHLKREMEKRKPVDENNEILRGKARRKLH